MNKEIKNIKNNLKILEKELNCPLTSTKLVKEKYNHLSESVSKLMYKLKVKYDKT